MSGVCKFVTAPATDPVTVLDINQPTNGMYVRGEDFSLGAPEWEAEPGMVGGDDGYRELSMTVAVDQSFASAAAHMSALSRVLQRPEGWLMLQRDDDHEPMFLHWYRTAPEPMSWELWHIDTYTLQVTLTCDPYLYGEPVTLPPVVITNNPASGANRAFVRFPDDTFLGDAPAPLKVDIVPSADWHGYQPLMASAALESGQDQAAPYWYDLTAPAWVAGTNVGGNVAAGGFVGGSYREMSAGGAMVTRLSGTLTSPPPPGTYKVMLRVATSTDNCTFAARFGQVYNVDQVRYGDTMTLTRPDTTIAAYATWMDLGEFTFPFGAGGLDALDIGAYSAPDVQIQAQQVVAGPPTIRFDALLLIPVDTAATVDAVVQTSRFHGFGLEVNRSGSWDGLKRRFLAYDSGVNLANLRPPELRGGWLRVWPGVVNVVHLLQQTQTDTPAFTNLSDSDVITRTATATFTYYPRYLHLRPDDG